MVRIYERAGIDLAPSNGVRLIAKIVIGVQSTPVPPVLRIPVEGIAAGLRDIVDVRAGQATKLPTIAVRHHTSFLHIIQAQS